MDVICVKRLMGKDDLESYCHIAGVQNGSHLPELYYIYNHRLFPCLFIQ